MRVQFARVLTGTLMVVEVIGGMIAAIVNDLSLLVIVSWILFEAMIRLIDTPDIAG